MTTKKILLLSMLTAFSIVLNWMENVFFPWTILPIPGVKIGLANALFLTVLLLAGFRLALALSVIRVVILAILTGTVVTVMFPLSLGGAVGSILFMALARFFFKEKLSLIGLSILGAIGHNFGQFLILTLIPGLFPGFTALYLIVPGLLGLSVPAGVITGWIARQIYPSLAKEWEP